MSSPPKKISSCLAGCGVLTAFLVILVSLAIFVSEQGAELPPVLSGTRAPEDLSPARNPIEQLLTSGPTPADRQGVATIVLLDVSGSMAEKVADAGGRSTPKIEIARRSVTGLVRHAEEFARKHPDLRIAVGLFEFSTLERKDSARTLVPLGPPRAAIAEEALARTIPSGGTPIGSAIIAAKLELDRSPYLKHHILVVTDGQNTTGYAPADVASVLTRLPEERRASLYFIAFDIAEKHFQGVRDAGALVLGAANERELQQTLDYVLTGKILAEQTPEPKKP